MSIRQLSTETGIAWAAADDESALVVRLGGSQREAVERWHFVFGDVLRIARREEGVSDAVR